MSFFRLAFRATIYFNLGVQSHHLFQFRCSKPSLSVLGVQRVISPSLGETSLLISALRATFLAFRVVFLFQFGVQTHVASIQGFHFLLIQHSESFLPFGSTFISFRRSKSCLQFGIQSHHPFQFGVQSHIFSLDFKVVFLVLTFRAISSILGIQCHLFQFKRLEPSFPVQEFRAISSSLGIQSHLFQFQAFRAISSSLGVQGHLFRFRRSEPSLPVLGIQCHLFQFQAFRVISSNLGVQSHAFRFRHSKPPFPFIGVQSHHFLIFTFRVAISIGLQSHSSHKHSQPQFSYSKSFISVLAFRATFQAFEVMTFQSLSSSLVCDIAL